MSDSNMDERDLSHNTTKIPTHMESTSEAGVQGRAKCYPRQISSTVSFPLQSRENYLRTPARITAGRQRGSDVESRSSPSFPQANRLTASDGDDRDSTIRSKGQHPVGRDSHHQRQYDHGGATLTSATTSTSPSQGIKCTVLLFFHSIPVSLSRFIPLSCLFPF